MEDKDDAASWRALRPEVRAFAQAMERKLAANDHKGTWDDCTPSWLLERIMDETRELVNAVHAACTGPHVENEDHARYGELARAALHEAADVANFCMMVADVLGTLEHSAPADPQSA